MSSEAIVSLIEGAKASNIFWQVAGGVTLGTTADMKGIVLCKTQVIINNGASLNGRALAQTAVTLDANSVTNPTVTVVKDGLQLNKYALLQNYPNPFNPSTKIQYSIEKTVHVSLKVYNLLGLEVATLVNLQQEPGNYIVFFNTNDFAHGFTSGVYFYRLEAGTFISTRKLILLK